MLRKTAFFIHISLNETDSLSLCAQKPFDLGFIPLLLEAAGAAKPVLEIR